MAEIDLFRDIAADPYAYGRQFKRETGGRIAGYLCSYAPEEMVFAAGALPFRVFSMNEGAHRADAHLQSYCCSLVRGILDEALAGRLDFIDTIIFPHTCDSIQRLSDIWRLNIPQHIHADLVLPVKLNTASAGQYLVEILNKLKNDLGEAFGVEITESAFGNAVRTYNRIRSLMMELYELRCEKPGVFKGRDFHGMIRAAAIMERTELARSLSAVLNEARKTEAGESESCRIILTGSVCNHPDIYGLIEETGGSVVWDDLCTGSRAFEGALDETMPPLEAIAKRMTERAICPAKHAGLQRRGEDLVRMAVQRHAQGVIFLLLKFCDPHAFDYPYIKAMLEREKIPCMLLDVEEQLFAGGQLRTRLETFMELASEAKANDRQPCASTKGK